MNRFLKLLNFEFNRFSKLFLILMVITFVLQLVAILKVSSNYMHHVNDVMRQMGFSPAQYVTKYGTTNFGLVLQSSWFTLSAAVCVVVMVIYVFTIWYRDWLGRATFIYQLLMLPITRLTLFWTKLLTILLGVLGLVSFQWILLYIERPIFTLMVPKPFSVTRSMLYQLLDNYFYVFIIPTSFSEFAVYYLLGLTAVAILFTAILIERSYRLKGIFLGIVYVVMAVLVFFIPVFIQARKPYFYPNEILILEIILGILIFIGSVGLSHFLLKRKITV